VQPLLSYSSCCVGLLLKDQTHISAYIINIVCTFTVSAEALTPVIHLITSPKINILRTSDNQRLFVSEDKEMWIPFSFQLSCESRL
jgi:hypothetical protein